MTALDRHRDWLGTTVPATWVALGAAAILLLVALGAIARHYQQAIRRLRFAHERMLGSEGMALELRAAAPAHARGARGLSEGQRRHVQQQWVKVCASFIDNPWSALRMANSLVKAIVGELGYRDASFEQRLRHLAKQHADVARHYQEARNLAEPSDRVEGEEATTEDLRRAMLHYSAIVEELVS
jgi:hypothetical protein